jgi:hypothetical protein
MEHLEVLLTPISLGVKEEVGQQILDNRITITIGKLLKLAPNLNTYLTTTSKQFAFSEGSTSKATIIVVATTIDHQMTIIVIHVKNNMVDNVLLDGGLGMNVIWIKEKLGLSPL